MQETSSGTTVTYGFSSTFISATKANAAGEHKITIDVNGKKFSAKRDKRTGAVKWGGGGRTLTPVDVAALQSMAGEVEKAYLADPGGWADLSGDTDLFIRFVLLLSEAPPGVKLKDVEVTAPVIRDEPAVAAPGPAASEEKCTVGAGVEMGGSAIAAAAACQRADDDGILYMTCSRLNRGLFHDAAGHCFESESVMSGPGSSGSLGECGTGIVGIGTYTYDCGEHDRCGRVHGGSTNPWDSECGDEYWDADDDFLWARPNRCE
jgi:hypothetical protein